MATYVEGEAPETDSEDDQYLFNLSYMKIGAENPVPAPNVAVNATKELLLKGQVVEGMSETQNLINTPVATEITEDYTPLYPAGTPDSPADFFYENELLRRKMNEVSSSMLNEFVQSTLAPISKQLIETDSSLINTQLTLQNVSSTMKEVSDRTKKIDSKFKALIDCDFLPNMKPPPPK